MPFRLMSDLLILYRRLTNNRQGGTAIEYTFLVAMIAIAIITMLTSIGGGVRNVLAAAGNALV